LTELVYCVTVAYTMTESANQQICINARAHSIALMQVCQHPYGPDLAPCDFWFFSKLKSPLKMGRFVNATVTQYTSSVNGVSLPTD